MVQALNHGLRVTIRIFPDDDRALAWLAEPRRVPRPDAGPVETDDSPPGTARRAERS